MAFQWTDTGIVVPPPAVGIPHTDDVAPGVLSLPVYPQEMTRIFTSDYAVYMIPSPDGDPDKQRGIYCVSGTQGKIRHASVLEIARHATSGILLVSPPVELSAHAGDNEIPGLAVQVQFVPVETQRPGHGPEYQLRLMCVRPRPDNSTWTLNLIYPDLPIYWRRRLPGG